MYCRIKRFYITALLIILASLATVMTARSQSDEESKKTFKDVVDTRGYLKNLQTASIFSLDSIVTRNLVHFRYNTKLYLSESLTGAIEFRSRLFFGESVKAQPGFGDVLEIDQGYWDLSSSLINEDAIVWHTILDRVWLNWSNDKWDVRVGRQRVNWGVNMVWNPNDLFNTSNFVDFDYEERPGSDGVRVTRYLKGMSSIEVAGRFSKNPDSTVVAGLFKFNKKGYDMQVLSGVYYEDLALGFGWAGNLKTAGLKGEATYFHPRYHWQDTSGILSASLSLDYSLKKPIYMTGSLLFNSGGATGSLDTLTAFGLGQDLTAKTLMPTQFSYFAQISGTINPLLTTNIAIIYGAGMDLLFLMPSLTYSISEAWDAMLLGQVAFANYQGNFSPLVGSLFIRTKWSF